MSLDLKYKWYVIYTLPRHEKKLSLALTIKGITNYCPTIKTIKQWSDRKKKVEEPLFRSYVFVNVSEKEYYDAIGTKGAVKYVSFGGKATPVRDEQIENIKSILSQNIDFKASTEQFKKGQKVEIEYGPMQGTKGEIISYSGKKYLILRIENIGYSLLVKIPPANVKLGKIKT